MDASVSQVVVEKILSYLERSFTPADVVWSGQPHHLTFGQPGKAECALALLHLVLERWLSTVEYDSFFSKSLMLILVLESWRHPNN